MRNVRTLDEIGVAEFIFCDKCATGSRINVHTAHAQTLSSRKLPVSCFRNDRVLGKRVR